MTCALWVVLIVGVSTSLGLGAIAWTVKGRRRRTRSRPAQEAHLIDDVRRETLRQIAAADYARRIRHGKDH